jgi:purine-binding chemotaxis protein CheW
MPPFMDPRLTYMTFSCDDHKFALEIEKVINIVQSVYVKPDADSPDFIEGTINYHEEILPLINLRSVFNLKSKEIDLEDHFVICESSGNRIAIWVDKALEPIEAEKEEISKFYYENENIEGLLKYQDEIIIINDLDKILRNKEYILFREKIK